MLIDWLQKPSTIVWGLYLAAAELASCLPSYSFSCILVSDENNAKDYSGNQSCATVHKAIFRFLKFIWVNATHDNINAFAAVAVAVFTFTLWRSTLKLWETGEKQIALAIESNTLTRDLFIAENRPWITVAAQIIDNLKSDNNRISFTIDVTLDNIGRLPANFVTNAFKGIVCGQVDPIPIMRRYCEGMITAWYSDAPRGITIFPGTPYNIKTSIWIDREDAEKNILLAPRIYMPMVIGGAFYRIGDGSIRYTGIVYHISVRYNDTEGEVLIFRLGENERIILGTSRLMKYSGGDFAT